MTFCKTGGGTHSSCAVKYVKCFSVVAVFCSINFRVYTISIAFFIFSKKFIPADNLLSFFKSFYVLHFL